MNEEERRVLARFWQGSLHWDYPMAKLTSLRVGGPAAAVLYPASRKELRTALEWLRGRQTPHWVIGRGTNILVPDQGLAGVVIVLGSRFSRLELRSGDGSAMLVEAEAGCPLPKLVHWCTGHGLSGLEFAAGIPGSVGGAIRMNAGAFGREIADVLLKIAFLHEGEEVSRRREELSFGYREWQCPVGAVVTAGVFGLERRPRDLIARDCRAAKARREASQPRGASAGSVFRNPAGKAAGALIERAGLKGVRKGGAFVSEVHANFIINEGTASARDIYDLLREVQSRVKDHTGVDLEPEIHLLGNWDGAGAPGAGG